jgi:catechol 2,3-dioxygenase-like lactoylglutathione lyase family enzyme
MVTVGALILISADAEATAAFYVALGIELHREQHDDHGPVHFAPDLAGCHFAVFPAEHAGGAPAPRTAGETIPCFRVDSVEETVEEVRRLGARVVQGARRLSVGEACSRRGS